MRATATATRPARRPAALGFQPGATFTRTRSAATPSAASASSRRACSKCSRDATAAERTVITASPPSPALTWRTSAASASGSRLRTFCVSSVRCRASRARRPSAPPPLPIRSASDAGCWRRSDITGLPSRFMNTAAGLLAAPGIVVHSRRHDNGKPVERRGRKATGLPGAAPSAASTTAGLPKVRQAMNQVRRDAAASGPTLSAGGSA